MKKKKSTIVLEEVFAEWSRGCFDDEVTRKRLYCTKTYKENTRYCLGCEYRRGGYERWIKKPT